MKASVELKHLGSWRLLLHWARLVFTPVSLLVIAVLVWQARDSLGTILQEGEWAMLLLVMLLWMASNLLSPLVTVHIGKICGLQISYWRTLSIHCGRLPAKYLPGGIWHSVGRANDYLELGHSPAKVAWYFAVENFLLIVVTLLIGTVVAPFLMEESILQRLLALLPLVMMAGLLLFPIVSTRLMKGSGPFPAGTYCIVLILSSMYWCMVGCTFAYYIAAFDALALEASFIEVAGIYIFSWSLGYLALFAPQGIGVAEFVSSSLLAGGSGASQILAFLIGFRLLVLVADMALWLLSRLWRQDQSDDR